MAEVLKVPSLGQSAGRNQGTRSLTKAGHVRNDSNAATFINDIGTAESEFSLKPTFKIMAWLAGATLLVVLGVLIATQSLVDDGKPGPEGFGKRNFYAVQLADILMFATLIWFAFRKRGRPAMHKRLALIATLSILDAAYDRWPVPVPWWDDRVTPLICTYPLLVLLMAYDWWTTRKVQPVTLWATVFLIVVQQGRDPFGHTGIWQDFAAWVYLHSQSWPIFRGTM